MVTAVWLSSRRRKNPPAQDRSNLSAEAILYVNIEVMPLNTKDKTKIAILGLDACDVDVMLRWTAEGRMPFLASLMEYGAFGRLISTKSMFSDSPWPSLNA